MKDHAEVVVSLAEAAVFTSNFAIARRLVVSYFQMNPQKDQYHCRAKLVLGLVIDFESRDLKGLEKVQGCERATKEIIEALDVAVAPSNIARYKFIVYNVSVAAWSIIRRFLRPGRAKYFATAFQQIVNALEQQDHADKDWRISLLSAVAVCFDDSQNAKGASDNVDKAIVLEEELLAGTVAQQNNVDKELNDCKKEVEIAMNAFRAIEDRDELMRKPRRIDPDLAPDDEYYTKPLTFPPLQGLAAEGKDKVKELLDLSQLRRTSAEQRLRVIMDRKSLQSETLLRLHRQRIAVNAADAKKYATTPSIVKDVRFNALVTLQCILCICFADKELEAAWTGMIKKLEDAPVSDIRNETLLDVSRAAWSCKQIALALKCQQTALSAPTSMSQILRIKIDICEGLHQSHQINEAATNASQKQLLNSRQLDGLRIAKRIEVVKHFERTLNMSVSVVKDKFIVQEICILMWNIMIPLFTNKLRSRVHSALKSMCVALETIAADSLAELRSNLHYELSLCEESADFASLALVEAQKAHSQDFGLVGVHPGLTDSNIQLDLNRSRDQYLMPWMQSLTLRIDVFASPSEATDQVFLWLQQAKESTSKSFVKDTITKAAVLLLEHCDENKPPPEAILVGGVVDWSLVLMKRGKLVVPEVPLTDLKVVLDNLGAASSSSREFSYPLQQKMQLLMTLARLAHRAGDVNVVQQCALLILRSSWNVADVFAASLLDDQIEVCCLLAESFSSRIQHSSIKDQRKGSVSTADNATALGIAATNVSSEITSMKSLALSALSSALALASARKDAYSVHNVLIYLWNLHLHVFRHNLYGMVMDELLSLLQKACTAVETMLSFPDSAICWDLQLCVNIFEGLSCLLEARGQSVEALDCAVKCINVLNFPIKATSSSAAFHKKNICERASKLQVYNAIKGGGAAAGKGKAVPAEPLAVPNNAFLAVFSCLAVAELLSSETLAVPAEVLLEAQARAQRMLSTEVKAQLAAEEAEEQAGKVLTTKETVQQRLEMQLEGFARLARLQILRGDFIGGQETAEQGVHLFEKFTGAKKNSETITSDESKLDLFDDDEEKQVEARLYRWSSACEANCALALISFLDASLQSSASASFDPALISRLQYVALQHVQPSTRYAVNSGEEHLVQRGAALGQVLLGPLLAPSTDSELQMRSFQLGMALVVDMKKITLTLETQTILRSIYISLVGNLMLHKDFENALKLVMQAFDNLDSSLHKELWPTRVVCMSKRGLNVLDGLQKLKEKDPVLQAQVLALFARATNDIGGRISAYQQAIDLLDNCVERVDYLLELAEVIATEGLPRSEVREILRNALDTYCEIEENRFEEIKDWEEGDDEEMGGFPQQDEKSTTRQSNKRPRSVTSGASKRRSSNPQAGDSRRQTPAPSVKGSSTGRAKVEDIAPKLPNTMDFKALEQSCRLWVMFMATEVRHDDRLGHMMKAFYYLRRCLELWQSALQEAHKMTVLEATPVDQRGAEIPIPSHLQVPDDALKLVKWVGCMDFCRITRTAPSTIHAKVPSAVSLPFLSATIFNLQQLLTALEESCLFHHALFVLAMMKMLLWSIQNEDSEDGAAPAMAMLQLKAVQIALRLGMPTDWLNDEKFILSGGSTMQSLGTVMDRFLATNTADHVQSDLSVDILFDVSFTELTAGGGLSAAMRKPALFLDSCKMTFSSLNTLDGDYYWVKVAELLLALGQVPAAQRLAVAMLWRCRLSKQSRLIAELATILSEIALMNGREREVTAWLLEQRNVLQRAGDPLLLTTQSRLLARAFGRKGMLQEAKDSLVLLLRMLEDLAVRKIEHAAVEQPSNNTMSQATLASRGTTKPASQPTPLYSQDEVGWEYLGAIKDSTLSLIKILLQETLDRMRDTASTRTFDPREGFSAIMGRLQKTAALIADHVGTEASWLSELSEARVRLTLVFVFELHKSKSAVVPLDEYSAWVDGQLEACELEAQKLLDMSQRWLSKTRDNLHNFSAAGVDNSVASASPSSDMLSFHAKQILHDSPITIMIPAEVRAISMARLFLASQQLLRDSFVNIHCKPSDKQDLEQEKSPIDAFLQSTAPPLQHGIDAFRASELHRCAQLSSTSLVTLGTRSKDSASRYAQLLYLTAQVVQCTRQGDFNKTNDTVLIAAKDWREALEIVVKDCADSESTDLRLLLPFSCCALIDSFVNSADHAAGSRYILLLQSLQMKQWLQGIWQAALPSKSELSAAQQRMMHMRNQHFCDVDVFPQYLADKVFIQRSTAVRR